MARAALQKSKTSSFNNTDTCKLLASQLNEEYGFHDIIGQSNKMREVFDLVEKVADCDSTILLNGETGTGKGLVAKAIHQKSNRKNKPFISINCGAIPENLLESELFGHVRGAFTGATSSKQGKFELADGGTILLDEIGDMSSDLQVKVLKVLEEGEFEQVGGIDFMSFPWCSLLCRNANQIFPTWYPILSISRIRKMVVKSKGLLKTRWR